MLKLGRVTKFKMLFLVLVFIFNFKTLIVAFLARLYVPQMQSVNSFTWYMHL